MLDEYQQRDLQTLNDPNEWPSAILPCIQRKDAGRNNCAFLVRGQGPKLFMKNMFELVNGPIAPQLIGVPTMEFDSFEAMLEAGWEVD